MANLHLVTGYAGESHVTSADQGTFHTAIFGSEQVVLGKGNKLAASVNGNTVTILDGDILMQGRYIRLAEGKSVNLVIEEGKEEKVRNDLIVARYTKNEITAIEECNLVVIKGTETEGVATDPEYISGNILDGDLVNDMPLYRVTVNGLAVRTPEVLFEVFDTTIPELITKKQDRTDFLEVDNDIGEVDTMPYFKRTDGTHKAIPWGIMKSKISAAFENPEQVGDLKVTVRTELGGKYLLANGAIFSGAEYPALADVIVPSTEKRTLTDSDKITFKSIEYANGLWVAVGISANDYYMRLYIANDPYGEWTKYTITNNQVDHIARIVYKNGMWVIAANTYSDGYPCVFMATDPTGTWTTQIVAESDLMVNDIEYGNGTWLITTGGKSAAVSEGHVYINQTNATGAWVELTGTLPGTTWGSVPFRTALYAEEMWVLGVGTYSGPNSTTWYTDNLYGTWSQGATITRPVHRMRYVDGMWYAVGAYSNATDFFETEDIMTSWTTSIVATNKGDGKDFVITKDGSVIIPIVHDQSSVAGVIFIREPGKSFAQAQSQSSTPTAFVTVAANGKTWVTFGYKDTTVYVTGNFKYNLPTVTVTNAYVYIKAKE